MSRQVISEDYTIDEHLKFLQMIDDNIDKRMVRFHFSDRN